MSRFGIVGHIEWGSELHLFAHELTHLAGGPEVWIGDGDDAVCFVGIVPTRGVAAADEGIGGVPYVCLTVKCLVDRGRRGILLVLGEFAIEHYEVAYGDGTWVGNALAVNTIHTVCVEVVGRVGSFDLLDIEGCVAVSGDVGGVVRINLFDVAHDIVLGASRGVSR